MKEGLQTKVSPQDGAQEKKQAYSEKSSTRLFKTNWEEDGIPIDLGKLLKGLLRHIWLIVVFALIGAGFGVYLSNFVYNKSTAEGVLMYRPNTPKTLPGDYPIYRMTLASSVEMIKLPRSLNALKSTLGLNLSTNQLAGMIEAYTPSKGSFLIKISAEAENPTLAKDLANSLSKIVVNQSNEMYRKQLQMAYNYFKTEVDREKVRLGQAIESLAIFQQKNELYGVTVEGSAPLRKLLAAEVELQKSTSRYNTLLVEYENYRREIERLPQHVTRKGAALLRGQIAELELSLISARSLYSSDNPKIRMIEAQMAAVEKQLEEEIIEGETSLEEGKPQVLREDLRLSLISMQSKLRAAQKMKEETALRLAEMKKETRELPVELTEYAKLLSERNNYEFRVRSNEGYQRSVELLMNVKGGDLEVYQGAEIRENSDLFLNILPLIGLVLGTLSGFFASLLLEVGDKKIRTAKQIELFYTIPCLLAVPKVSSYLSNSLSERLLFYIRIITERLNLASEGPFQSLNVASAVDGEGKSLFAYHLAKYYSAHGKKTVLLNFDSIPNPFLKGREFPSYGFSSYLKGDASLKDITGVGELDIIRVDGMVPEMNELVGTNAMKKFWDELTNQYEMIIMETPGIIKENYALTLARYADLNLQIVNSSRTEKKYVDAAIGQLEVANIRPCGIILNNALPEYTDDVRITEESKRYRQGFLKTIRGLVRKKK